VGAGLTGAVTASHLRSAMPAATLELWEKAAAPGGRMCTKRSPLEPRTPVVDMGAQYISTTPEDLEVHHEQYSALLDGGVIRALAAPVLGCRRPKEDKHFVAPRGMAAVVQHFVGRAKPRVRTQTLVESISSAPEGGWEVSAGDVRERFDRVVITIPVPQMLNLGGDLLPAIDGVAGLRTALDSVRYSARFCLAAFFPADSRLALPGQDVAREVSDAPCGMYVHRQDVPFCFVAVDTARRGVGSQDGISVLAHTSHAWGQQHIEATREEMLPVLRQHLMQLFPEWPSPVAALCHKWRYSQVQTGPGLGEGAIEVAPGLVLTGDAFTHSHVTGCLQAARSASHLAAAT